MESNKALILLCEDDTNYGQLLADILRGKGYEVVLKTNGVEAWQTFQQNKFDFGIFDVMMPLKTGLELAHEIRQTGSDMPFLFLSQKQSVEDILKGYAEGADDYVVKPCKTDILICKIEAILKRYRRQVLENKTEFEIGSLKFDAVHQVLLAPNGQKVRLSSRENDLLKMLAQNLGFLVDRNVILKQIWHNDSYFCSRSLSVYINHLRNHLALDQRIKIMSVHGKGYKMVVED